MMPPITWRQLRWTVGLAAGLAAAPVAAGTLLYGLYRTFAYAGLRASR
jgi:hypothetical protein